MTKIQRVWVKMTFWEKLKKSLRLVAGLSLTGMGFEEAPYWAFIALGIFGLIAETIDVWIVDSNNNGIADIAE